MYGGQNQYTRKNCTEDGEGSESFTTTRRKESGWTIAGEIIAEREDVGVSRTFAIAADGYGMVYDGVVKSERESGRSGSKMFCHRNTINYRLRIIKEELEYDLSDAEVRFQLMAAYKLREIRKA